MAAALAASMETANAPAATLWAGYTHLSRHMSSPCGYSLTDEQLSKISNFSELKAQAKPTISSDVIHMVIPSLSIGAHGYSLLYIIIY